MIIKAFSEYLKEFDDGISANILLIGWLKYKLSREPKNKVDIVINKEIALTSDENCDINFVGKSKSGKELLNSLFVFADSYDQQRFSRWIHNIKASDFGNLSIDL